MLHPQDDPLNKVAKCMLIHNKLWIGSIGPVEAEQLHFEFDDGEQQKSRAAKQKAAQMHQNEICNPRDEPLNMVARCMLVHNKLLMGSIGPGDAVQLHF